jgi:ubiquinone/menaquinone biosynthesis C-methylase UbiE
MNNKTINNLIKESYRILKTDGYLIIKEHDSTEDNREYIYWEHHLYHILDCGYNNKLININEYMKNCKLYNFKSKEEWEELINKHNFKIINRYNRFLDGEFTKDNKNPSNLYWDIYKKN